MNHEIKSQIGIFTKLYCTFFNTDLESSLLDGRNFIAIDMFRITLMNIMSSEIEPRDIPPLTKKLSEMVEDEKDTYSSITCINCNHYSAEITRDAFKKTLSNFIDFFIAYDFLHCVFTIETGENFNALEDRKFQDI